MTCKDNCLYSPVCRLPFNTSETQVEFAEVCHHFKNKADFVEVKHGRWKGAGLGDYYCSLCCENYSGGNSFNFCPRCGADMREEGADNGRIHKEKGLVKGVATKM